MNTQIPTKRIKSDGDKLLVHSIFHTIQGEGPFTGVPAVFVRLGGCNLQCPGCDTEYTKQTETMTKEVLLKNIRFKLEGNTTTELIVITGGEPFLQNLTKTIQLLQLRGYTVQIETNGSIAPQEEIPADTIIVCSPKTTKLNPKMLPYITAYKYVLNWDEILVVDGLPIMALENKATPYVARPHEEFEGDIYVSPMDMTEYYDYEITGSMEEQAVLLDIMESQTHLHNQENIKACIASSMLFGYTLQIQLHKFLEME